MPAVSAFIDTNLLIYAHNLEDEAKERRAKEWLLSLARFGVGRVNLQVLNEFTNVMLRRRWLPTEQAVFDVADRYAVLGNSPVTDVEVASARLILRRYRFSWWDSLLLASALELGCTHFLSEDLQDGQVIAGLTIVDPFAHSPGQFIPAH